ncbi:MAG: hypothetical protein V3V96_10995 [Acidiferrobacterales bacterium]
MCFGKVNNKIDCRERVAHGVTIRISVVSENPPSSFAPDVAEQLIRLKLTAFKICLLLAVALPATAQITEESAKEDMEPEIGEEEAIESDSDGSLDDAINSIDVIEVPDGVGLSADVRIGYFESEIDERDATSQTEDLIASRWRFRTEAKMAPHLRAVGRIAGICSNVECSPNLVLEDSIPTTNGMSDGDITIDEGYFHWFRLDRFDLALGRLQTKFVARGGVFAKSLDRNDSNNINVNWTDGLHATFGGKNSWVPHLILQHNSPNGASNVRRGPLDFDDSGARVSYFFGTESLKRTRLFLQRGVDISYLPKSLLKDGSLSGRREDYYGIVVRTANRWPERDEGIRLRVAAELGYAPETQTRTTAGLVGDGDADGLAWNVVLSLMDFKPNHSIGVNYGRVGAGWLLSPQFRQNESLAEIRYQWRKSRQLAFDFRIRQRKELEQMALTVGSREELDVFLRLTWGGSFK